VTAPKQNTTEGRAKPIEAPPKPARPKRAAGAVPLLTADDLGRLTQPGVTFPSGRRSRSIPAGYRDELVKYLRREVTVVLTDAVAPDPADGRAVLQTVPAIPVRFAKSDVRTAISDGVAKKAILLNEYADLAELPRALDDDGANWRTLFLTLAPAALLDAAAELIECEDLGAKGSNPLSSIGTLVSIAVRRVILREVLVRHGWNLTAVGVELRLGGVSNVLRTILDLGLETDLEQARMDGTIKRGRPRRSVRKR
jgi:hypothetical protein